MKTLVNSYVFCALAPLQCSVFFRINGDRRMPTAASTPPSTWDNPTGIDGFEFIVYAAPDPAYAGGALFERILPAGAPPAQERHALPPGRD